MEPIYQAPFIWIRAWNKNCGKLKPGIVACTVIPQMGGWTLRNGWLIKFSYMVHNELYACQVTETKVQKNTIQGQCMKHTKSYVVINLSISCIPFTKM